MVKITTTVARRHLQLVMTAFNDVRTIRGGTIPCFAKVAINGEKVTFFTVTPDTNAAIHIGKAFEEKEDAIVSSFTLEDLKAILNYPEAMVELTFIPEQSKFLATSTEGTRKVYRPSTTPQEDVTTRLNSLTKDKGTRLMTMTADFIQKVADVATSGMDVQADVTHRTMFKLESADTLNFYKYISENVSIFGKLPIANGDPNHTGISGFQSVFASSNNFASAFNTFIQAAKGESTMDISIYLNGTKRVATLMAKAENISFTFVYTGIQSSEEIQEYTAKFSTSFEKYKIMEVVINAAKLSEILADFTAVANSQEAFIVFGTSTAELQSVQEDNGTPIYSATLGEATRKMIVKKQELEEATRKFPVIPSNLSSMLRSFEKFDTVHADDITLTVYLVAMNKAEFRYILELSSNEHFRGWMTIVHRL